MSYHVNTCHPFVHSNLILSRPVMDMLDGASHDLSNPRRRLGPSRVNDPLSESRIKLLARRLCGIAVDRSSVGRHLKSEEGIERKSTEVLRVSGARLRKGIDVGV